MIYAVVESLSADQWELVAETWETARTSSSGAMIVKWAAPTPPQLQEFATLTPAEALALMQTNDWQEGAGG